MLRIFVRQSRELFVMCTKIKLGKKKIIMKKEKIQLRGFEIDDTYDLQSPQCYHYATVLPATSSFNVLAVGSHVRHKNKALKVKKPRT